MLKLFKTFSMLLLCNVVVAQAHHFIYIENTKKEWFTVKVNDKIYESIGKNFITISQLENGNYTLLITTQSSKEAAFEIAINNEDKGFSIKQNDDKAVELFDINSFKIIAANKIDNTIKEAEKTITKQTEPLQIEESKIAIVANKIIKSNVKKIYSKPNKEGIDEIYVDGSDTIAIYIPQAIIKETPKTVIEDVGYMQASTETTGIAVNTQKNSNSNCKVFAEETDVKNFLIAAQAELKVKDRLKVANNFLKEKCYSVNQIKRLCNLFINSNGKFIFFKQAQQSISDMQNFETLQSELTDTAIVEEFKAFVKQL